MTRPGDEPTWTDATAPGRLSQEVERQRGPLDPERDRRGAATDVE